MNRTHQTFSEQEKDKLLREVKNLYHVFAVFTLEVAKRCLLAKARPDPDLRYRSSCAAVVLSRTAIVASIVHGANLEV